MSSLWGDIELKLDELINILRDLDSEAAINGLNISNWNIAIQIDNHYAKSYMNRGLIYLKELKYNLALDDFNKAMALNPNDPIFYFNRARIWKAIGREEEAWADMLKAKSLDLRK